uniref:SCP domain-containing protein n=1 Tax=Steinernema glaseri TaxID=37863 RepID=A0A1I7ZB59_9BILA
MTLRNCCCVVSSLLNSYSMDAHKVSPNGMAERCLDAVYRNHGGCHINGDRSAVTTWGVRSRSGRGSPPYMVVVIVDYRVAAP